MRPVENLVELFFTSVGRNSKLLLNVPPTREGLLHEVDVARLRGMRERLQQHGGDIKIETRPGAGFSLQLTLPVSAAAAAARQGAIA